MFKENHEAFNRYTPEPLYSTIFGVQAQIRVSLV